MSRQPLKLIGVGKAGSGKTVNTLEGCPRPVFAANVDRKLHTLEYLYKKKMLKELSVYADDFDPKETLIQHIPIQSKGFADMFQVLQQVISAPPMNENGEPGTFVLDSLTTIADNAISYGLSLRGQSGKSMGVIPIPDWPEWLGESMFLSSLFTDCKDLPCNVILLAHLTITTRDVMIKGGPSVTRETQTLVTGGTKIAAKIPVWFDEVYEFRSVPSTRPGELPTHKVFTRATESCDFARTKLDLPYEIDVTYPYADGQSAPLWDYLNAAIDLADEWRGKEDEKADEKS